MRTYQDLTVWQKSMILAEQVYVLTSKLPKSEVYGLSSQMQRAAVSIPSNIAEGARRESKLEYIHFLSIANGSAAELETQLLLAFKLFPHITEENPTIRDLIIEISKMLYSLIKSIKTTTNN